MESADRKEDFLNLVKLRFAHLQPKFTLKVFGISTGSLKEYHTTPNKKKYNITNMPTEDFRLYDEEIKSSIEYAKDSFISTDDTENEDIFDLKSRT
jgi:hypothetical protein